MAFESVYADGQEEGLSLKSTIGLLWNDGILCSGCRALTCAQGVHKFTGRSICYGSSSAVYVQLHPDGHSITCSCCSSASEDQVLDISQGHPSEQDCSVASLGYESTSAIPPCYVNTISRSGYFAAAMNTFNRRLDFCDIERSLEAYVHVQVTPS